MKLRNPQGEPPVLLADGKPLGYWEKSLDMSLITPIYGGGVKAGQPDKAMPIRASAIRGQLRFWWRLLNRHRFHDNKEMYQAETAIWGGLGSGELGAASRVVVRVSCKQQPRLEQGANYDRDQGRYKKKPHWANGWPGYALFPGQGQFNEANNGFKEGKEPAKLISPNLEFTLRIGIWSNAKHTVEGCQTLWESDILPALRWWASFGGVGARTRRGLGSVQSDLIPVTNEEVKAVGCQLQPRYPNNNAESAWKEAVGKLRDFRQGEGIGRKPHNGKDTPGRSFWPEADSIRQITGHHSAGHAPTHPARIAFPRAVFGLPIITHYNGNHEPADTTLSPLLRGEKQDRLASPLILKAMWNGSDYTPIALLLPHDHVSQMGLQLEGGGLAMPRVFQSGNWWPATAQTAMTTGAQPNPLHGETGDVLADFLKFFGS
jgi:CRISPR-associated protein Cmr1